MTGTTARTLHRALYVLEVLLAVIVLIAAVVVARSAWTVITAWPTALSALAFTYLAAGAARLSFETARAGRALSRWHTRPHRNIRDRTEPDTPRRPAPPRPASQPRRQITEGRR